MTAFKIKIYSLAHVFDSLQTILRAKTPTPVFFLGHPISKVGFDKGFLVHFSILFVILPLQSTKVAYQEKSILVALTFFLSFLSFKRRNLR